MSAAPSIFQGEDKTIIVGTNIDLTAHIEIEFIIDTPTQIIKTLTGGHITGVTFEQYTVQIDAADTTSIKSGNYKYQTRATNAAGKITNGQFHPNKFIIKHSAFENADLSSDYG